MPSDYITDPELLSKLEATESEDSGYVTDPKLLAQLDGEAEESVTQEAPAAPIRRSRASDLAKALEDNKLFSSATTALEGAQDKGIRRRPDGDWDLPNITSQDGGKLNALKNVVVSNISQKLGDRLPAPEKAPGRDEEIKAIQKVFHDFQQANNLSDEEVQSAWSDLGNTQRTWTEGEKLRVLSDGSIVPNPQDSDWLDPVKSEQLIAGASAPQEAKDAALRSLPQARANLASEKIAAYEAAAEVVGQVSDVNPAGAIGAKALEGFEPPSEWAKKQNRTDVGTPQFVLDYEKDVFGRASGLKEKLWGLAGRVVTGGAKVGTQILGTAGLAGSDTATRLAGEAVEGTNLVRQGLPETGIVGDIVEEIPSIGAQMATGRMLSVFGKAPAVLGTFGAAGLQSAGLTYADEIAQGTTEDVARDKAARAGITTTLVTAMFGTGSAGAVERVAVGQAAEEATVRQVLQIAKEQGIKNLAKSPELRSLAGGVAKAYLGEASEEGIDQILQAFLLADPNENLAAAWSDAVKAFQVGGAIGGAVDVAQRAATDLAMGAVTVVPDSAKAAMEPITPTPTPDEQPVEPTVAEAADQLVTPGTGDVAGQPAPTEPVGSAPTGREAVAPPSQGVEEAVEPVVGQETTPLDAALKRKREKEEVGGLTGEWKPVASDEPPVAEGHVRFYHAGSQAGEGERRWLTPNREWASNFRKGAPVFFVDVPVTDPQLRKSFDDTGVPMSSPFINFEADEATSAKLTPLPVAGQETGQVEPPKPGQTTQREGEVSDIPAVTEPVVVNETPVRERQTGLSVADETQTPQVSDSPTSATAAASEPVVGDFQTPQTKAQIRQEIAKLRGAKATRADVDVAAEVERKTRGIEEEGMPDYSFLPEKDYLTQFRKGLEWASNQWGDKPYNDVEWERLTQNIQRKTPNTALRGAGGKQARDAAFFEGARRWMTLLSYAQGRIGERVDSLKEMLASAPETETIQPTTPQTDATQERDQQQGDLREREATRPRGEETEASRGDLTVEGEARGGAAADEGVSLTPAPYSKDAMVANLGVTPEQAEAVDALIQASGLDVSRVVMTRGGTPGSGLRQAGGVLTDAEYQRHADLEARKDSLTPEELREAEALVEKAARGAGYNRQGVRFGFYANGVPLPPSRSSELNFGPGYYVAEDAELDTTSAGSVSVKSKANPRDLERLGLRPEDVEFRRDKVFVRAAKPMRTEYGGNYSQETAKFIEAQVAYDSAVQDARRTAGLPFEQTSFAKTVSDMIARGDLQFDSLQGMTGRSGMSSELVVQDPAQIKSSAAFTGVPLRERFNPESPSILYQAEAQPVAPAFYSQLERTLDQKIRGKQATPEQVKALLTGLKAEEVKWSGIEQKIESLAAENGGKVPKAALLDHLRNEGAVRLEEVTLVDRLNYASFEEYFAEEYDYTPEDGPLYDSALARARTIWDRKGGLIPLPVAEQNAKFGQYVLPGGENYREVVLAMPNTKLSKKQFLEANGITEERWNAMDATEKFYWDGRHYTEHTTAGYTSSHFPDVQDYVAHMRLNERTDAEGNPGLFIEEIQSDRHQAGREKGYREDQSNGLPGGYEIKNETEEARKAGFNVPANRPDEWQIHHRWGFSGGFKTYEEARQQAWAHYDATEQGEKVADAPFRKDWPLQMFKRALADAVASGKEWIGWTVGETQNDRFDLSKQVHRVIWEPKEDGSGRLKVIGKESDTLLDQEMPASKVEDYIGKEAASRLFSQPVEKSKFFPDSQALSGDGLKVGGSGMKGFYDQILPKEIGKYVKQWGGKVEASSIGTKDRIEDVGRNSENGRYYLYDSEGNPMDEEFDTRDEALAASRTPIWRIDITPEMRASILRSGQPLFQDRQGNKGSIEFLEDGSTLIRGLQSPDVSTAAHEFAHLIRRQLLNRDAPAEGITAEDIETVEKWAGAKEGTWSVAAEEKFARGWERYLADGKAPVARLQEVFDKFAKWLGDIYGRIAGSAIDIEITPEVRAVMDKLVTRNLENVFPEEDMTPLTAAEEKAATEFFEKHIEETGQTGLPPMSPVEPPPGVLPEPTEGLISNMKRYINAARARRGLPPLEKTPQATFPEMWDMALRAEAEHTANALPGTAGNDLLTKLLNEKPQALDDAQFALLLHEQAVRYADADYKAYLLNQLPEGSPVRDDRKKAYGEAQDAYNIITTYIRSVGSIRGAQLNAIKMIVDQDFSLVHVKESLHAAKNAKSDKPVAMTPDDHARAEAWVAKYEKLKAKVDGLEQSNTLQAQLIEQLVADVEQAKAKVSRSERAKVLPKVRAKLQSAGDEARARIEARKQARLGAGGPETLFQSGPSPDLIEDLKDYAVIASAWFADATLSKAEFLKKLTMEFGAGVAKHVDYIRGEAKRVYLETEGSITGAAAPTPQEVVDGIDAEADEPTRQDIRDLARAHIIADDTMRGDKVMKAVMGDLATLFPKLTPERLSEIFTNYGKTSEPDPDPVEKELRRVGTIERIGLKLADVRAGRIPKKTGAQRDETDADIRTMEKQFRDEYRGLEKKLRDMGVELPDDAKRIKSAIGAVKRRMQNEIEELQRAIEKGVARNAGVRRTVEYDEEATRLKSQLEAKRAEYDQIFGKKLSEEQKIEATLRYLDAQIAAEEKMLADGVLKKDPAVRLSTPQIDAKRDQLAKMREHRRSLYAAQHPEVPLEQAKRNLVRSNEKLAKMIADNDVRVKRKEPVTPDAELAALQENHQVLIDWVRELRKELGQTPEQQAAKLRRDIEAAERTLEKVKTKLDSGDLSVPVTPQRQVAPQVKRIRDQVKALNAELDLRRKEAQVGPYSEEARIHRRLGSIEKRLKETKRRIKEQDFSRNKVPAPVNSREVLEAQYELDRHESQLHDMRVEMMLKNAPLGERLWHAAGSLSQSTKVLVLGGDWGALIRNLNSATMWAVATDTINGAKVAINKLAKAEMTPSQRESVLARVIRKGYTAAFSRAKHADFYRSILQRPNARWYDAMGIKLIAPFDKANMTGEDIPPARLIEKMPWWVWPVLAGASGSAIMMFPALSVPLAMSWGKVLALVGVGSVQKELIMALDRAQQAMTNEMRVTMADMMLDTLPHGASVDDARAIGHSVNVATGRGGGRKGSKGIMLEIEKMMPGMNKVLLASRFYLARIQALLLQPLYSGPMSGKTRKMIAANYAKTVSARTAVYALLLLAFGKADDDDPEDSGVVLNPYSKDFLKIRITKNLAFDVMGGFNQFMTLMIRQSSGVVQDKETGRLTVMTPSEKKRDLSGFGASKLNLLLKFGLDSTAGEYFGGKPRTFLTGLNEISSMIILDDLVKVAEEAPNPAVATGVSLLMLSGGGINVGDYEEEKKKWAPLKAEIEAIRRKHEAELNQ